MERCEIAAGSLTESLLPIAAQLYMHSVIRNRHAGYVPTDLMQALNNYVRRTKKITHKQEGVMFCISCRSWTDLPAGHSNVILQHCTACSNFHSVDYAGTVLAGLYIKLIDPPAQSILPCGE